MILSKSNILYKNKPITIDVLYNDFTPALMQLYLDVYNSILKMDSQYGFYANGCGVNGVPEGFNSYLEYLGMISPFASNLESMDGDEQRRVINRKWFEKWTTNGWSGSDDTPKNNANIIKYCMRYNEDMGRFLSEQQIIRAKKYLDSEQLEFVNKYIAELKPVEVEVND